MLIELIHPNGINTVLAEPRQVEFLKRYGWREANPEPVKEVVSFSEEISKTIEKKKQESEQPVDVTEPVAEDKTKPKPRNTTRKKPTTRRRKK